MALVVKDPPTDAGDARDTASIPGSGRPPGEGDGNPLQYSCLGSPMDRGTWWTTVHGVAKESDTTECTSTHTHMLEPTQETLPLKRPQGRKPDGQGESGFQGFSKKSAHKTLPLTRP